MIKRYCDVCKDEMPDDYEPVFVFTYNMKQFKVLMMLACDEDETDEDGDVAEDICHDCAKEALENAGFIEDDI